MQSISARVAIYLTAEADVTALTCSASQAAAARLAIRCGLMLHFLSASSSSAIADANCWSACCQDLTEPFHSPSWRLAVSGGRRSQTYQGSFSSFLHLWATGQNSYLWALRAPQTPFLLPHWHFSQSEGHDPRQKTAFGAFPFRSRKFALFSRFRSGETILAGVYLAVWYFIAVDFTPIMDYSSCLFDLVETQLFHLRLYCYCQITQAIGIQSHFRKTSSGGTSL